IPPTTLPPGRRTQAPEDFASRRPGSCGSGYHKLGKAERPFASRGYRRVRSLLRNLEARNLVTRVKTIVRIWRISRASALGRNAPWHANCRSSSPSFYPFLPPSPISAMLKVAVAVSTAAVSTAAVSTAAVSTAMVDLAPVAADFLPLYKRV